MVVIQGRNLTKIYAQFCNFKNVRRLRHDEDSSDAAWGTHALSRTGNDSPGNSSKSRANGHVYAGHCDDGSFRDDDDAVGSGKHHERSDDESAECRA
ncbi:hypothetical protein PR002_g32702 [Phytophthora rubi]|uniref:Uncharacterized protein n=1 Tax=Phytophthora rubi TaxID=129364 RepID=A0A6A3GEG6_9STRA|nr:hypothetical protein PR002_g32702 [Phytophthora rubi]